MHKRNLIQDRLKQLLLEEEGISQIGISPTVKIILKSIVCLICIGSGSDVLISLLFPRFQ